MIFKDAKQLHNGDEVTLKTTGESITVLSASVFDPRKKTKGVRPSVCIEGIGKRSGYGEWVHVEVK